jgi:hypothetical protein
MVALVLALAAMSLSLLGTAVGHAPIWQFSEFYQGGGAQGLSSVTSSLLCMANGS